MSKKFRKTYVWNSGIQTNLFQIALVATALECFVVAREVGEVDEGAMFVTILDGKVPAIVTKINGQYIVAYSDPDSPSEIVFETISADTPTPDMVFFRDRIEEVGNYRGAWDAISDVVRVVHEELQRALN